MKSREFSPWLSHSANLCLFAISYSVLLYGDIMWKELITALESGLRYVKMTALFYNSPLNITVSMDMFVIE